MIGHEFMIAVAKSGVAFLYGRQQEVGIGQLSFHCTYVCMCVCMYTTQTWAQPRGSLTWLRRKWTPLLSWPLRRVEFCSSMPPRPAQLGVETFLSSRRFQWQRRQSAAAWLWLPKAICYLDSSGRQTWRQTCHCFELTPSYSHAQL